MKVSILIPCYNAERWIGQAILSALDQTWADKEVIVVDDGSTDGSLDVIRSFGAAIRWESGPNRGGNVARNRLLELADGEWLQYLDADDYLLPRKVHDQLADVDPSTALDAVYSPVILEYWRDGEPVRQEVTPIPTPHDPWILLARWFLPQTGAVLWRREALVDAGGWKPDQPCCQEHELYLRALMSGKRFAYCATPGAVYRQWCEQTVCKKNQPEVHRRRLEIEQRMEEWLRQCVELTPARLQAINQARFETARSVWQYDRLFAAEIMRRVRNLQPDFSPSGAAGPSGYRATYYFFGFGGAEFVAEWKRRCTAFKSQLYRTRYSSHSTP